MKNLKSQLYILIFLMTPFMSIFAQITDESWKVYDDTQLARADITIKPEYLQWLYANVKQDSEFVATIHFKNKYIDETIDSVGFRLRGATSRESQKKSFKVALNAFRKGGKLYGCEKLNFNGEHNDPSIMRSKLSFDLFKAIGVPAARASHIQVYINGAYYGLYISIEQLDENFLARRFADDSGNLWKCTYGADLQYKNDNPATYSSMMNGSSPVFELSTNEAKNDFMPLVRLIRLLNKTASAQLADSIDSYIDLAGVLHYFAMNITIGGWDDYWGNMNNFYLYFEPRAGKFHILPYDYDNTFGIDWFNVDWSKTNPYTFSAITSGPRPLATKILGIPEYRNLYTHFLEFLRTRVFQLPLWEGRIDSLKQMIALAAADDQYRTKDYGFSFADFSNSYSASSYTNQHVKMGLKQFMNARSNSLPGMLNYVTAKPVVYSISFTPQTPKPTDTIRVFASAFSMPGVGSVSIHFKPSGSATELIYPMTFSPVPGTKIVEEADRYIGVIPPLGINGSGAFTIEVKDIASQSAIYPRTKTVPLKASGISSNGVVINEFLADNKLSATDAAGEHDDWVELYNTTDAPVKLTGLYMTDSPTLLNQWRFTKDSLYIGAHQYLVVWCDNQLTQAGVHSNFKLSKSGEYIALVDTDGVTVIDSLSFGAQTTDISWGRQPDGAASWAAMAPTPGAANLLTAVATEPLRPLNFELSAYPNPFNPGATIRYTLPSVADISIKVYDVLGKEVKTLVTGEMTAGTHSFWFDASACGSGVYFCRLTGGNFAKTVKLVVVK